MREKESTVERARGSYRKREGEKERGEKGEEREWKCKK